MKNINKRKSYSKEYKEKQIERMLPPENLSASQLSDEIGVAQSTLSKWLRKNKNEKMNKQSKVDWITVDINDEKSKKEKNSVPINIKIGKVMIEINEGFNSNLLLEVMKVVNNL